MSESELLRAQNMTLRDFFAGLALLGLCAAEGFPPRDPAALAYKLADKMMEQRKMAVKS